MHYLPLPVRLLACCLCPGRHWQLQLPPPLLSAVLAGIVYHLLAAAIATIIDKLHERLLDALTDPPAPATDPEGAGQPLRQRLMRARVPVARGPLADGPALGQAVHAAHADECHEHSRFDPRG